MKTQAHRSGWYVAVLLAAGAVALAGCGGGSEEPAQQTPQTSDATSGAPSAQAARPAGDDASAMDAIAGTPERVTDAMDSIPAAGSSMSTAAGASAAGLTWESPEGWIVVPTTSSGMRAAQYTAPAPSGSALAPAEVVFFYFGAEGQGGGLSANLERWSSQVLDASGAPTPPSVANFQLGDLDVTTAIYKGTYLSGMPGQDRTPLRGWALLAAVVEGGPEGSLFIRMTGPDPVVDAQREAFEVMIRTLGPVASDEGGEPTK